MCCTHVWGKTLCLVAPQQATPTNEDTSISSEIAETMAELPDDEVGEHVALLRSCVDNLQKEAGSLIQLRYFEKKSCKEIAEIKGRTVTWVTSNLSRSRQALRRCMEQRMEQA